MENKNKIIGYVYFSTSSDFEKWQKMKKVEIINIYPIIPESRVDNNIDYGANAKPIMNSTMKHDLSVFVTFYKDIYYEE